MQYSYRLGVRVQFQIVKGSLKPSYIYHRHLLLIIVLTVSWAKNVWIRVGHLLNRIKSLFRLSTMLTTKLIRLSKQDHECQLSLTTILRVLWPIFGWSLRKRSIATEYFDTQGKSNQKDRRSISVVCCKVPVQMLKDDLEPKSFGSNGSFWFFNCWSLVALSKSRSKVLLLQFLQLKPPPGKSTQFSEGGEVGVIFVVVYSISRKACWQSMAPGTCFELVGTNNLPCSSLAMPGHTPALTFFFQLKMCCEEKQTSWGWRSLTEEITSEDEKVTWLVKIWFVRL